MSALTTINVQLVGTKPLLLHNGRLANPLDPYTRDLAAISKKRNKTDDDRYDMMAIEARGGCYETADGLLAFPTANVWRSIYDAAKKYKLGKACTQALFFDDVNEPIYIDGSTVHIDNDNWLQYGKVDQTIDYRPVKVGMAKAMRARPVVPAGWVMNHRLALNESELELDSLAPVFVRAGEIIGLGDWRPNYGTYKMKVVA